MIDERVSLKYMRMEYEFFVHFAKATSKSQKKNPFCFIQMHTA